LIVRLFDGFYGLTSLVLELPMHVQPEDQQSNNRTIKQSVNNRLSIH